MRSLLLTLLASLLLPLSVTAGQLEPFTAHYDLRFSGLGGESVMTLTQNPEGTYVLENRTRAKGLARLARPHDAVDRSEFRMDGDTLRPVAFRSEDGTRRNKRGSTIAFDWDAGNASTIYKGETKSLELEAGTLDRQLLQIAMMSDLANGATEIEYTVVDRDALKTYTFAVVAEEQVEVPAGRYDAIKIIRKRPGSSRSSIMWCAPSLGYLTVRMEQLKEGKVIGTLQLTNIE